MNRHFFYSLSLLTLSLIGTPALAGEFGNQCTNGLAQGAVVNTDCSIQTILKGKTYCFSNQEGKDAFMANPDAMLRKANAFYETQSAPSPAKDKEVMQERKKISQDDAINQIKSAHCDLSNRDAGYLELDGMDLRHCNMQNTSFFGAYLRGAYLSGANLEGAYLNLARLEKTNLSGANLKNASIFQAIFDKTNFKNANLENARMIGTLGNVDMSEAHITHGRFGLDIGNQPMGAMRFDAVGGNFADTDFEGADINRSNFQFANFRCANLRNTDLFRADLSKADLTGADISGANMKEAILDGTIMTKVSGLEAIDGYDIAKGKCVDCTLPVASKTSAAQTATNSRCLLGHALQGRTVQ